MENWQLDNSHLNCSSAHCLARKFSRLWRLLRVESSMVALSIDLADGLEGLRTPKRPAPWNRYPDCDLVHVRAHYRAYYVRSELEAPRWPRRRTAQGQTLRRYAVSSIKLHSRFRISKTSAHITLFCRLCIYNLSALRFAKFS